MIPYNYPPRLLGRNYWVLAEIAGILLPPLRAENSVRVAPLQMDCCSVTPALDPTMRTVPTLLMDCCSVPPVLDPTIYTVQTMYLSEHIPTPSPALSATPQPLPVSCLLSPASPAAFVSPAAIPCNVTMYLPWHQWTADNVLGATPIYIFVLTGGPDGVDDVELPITSAQVRTKTEGLLYLSVVVPGLPEYLDAAALRPNGEIVLSMGYKLADGSRQLEELVRADRSIASSRIDTGPRSVSITLTGWADIPDRDQRTVELANASYIRTSGTGTTVRTAPDPWVRPGDQVIVNRTTFTVSAITYVISVALEYMEITETIT